MPPVQRTVAAVGAGLLAAVLAAAPAAAHVTADPNEGPAGGFAFHELRISHGCGDSPTVEVAIQIPEEVESVTPEVQPGWEIELVREEPAEGQGGADEEARVTEVRWSGGSLPSDRVDHFGLSVQYAEGIDADAVFFPTIQRCFDGGELAWIDVPTGGEDPRAFFDEAESPAPFVRLAADEGSHGGGADDVDDSGDEGDDSEDVALDDEPAADGDDSDTLAIAALIVGALGLVAGVGGFVRGGRREQA